MLVTELFQVDNIIVNTIILLEANTGHTSLTHILLKNLRNTLSLMERSMESHIKTIYSIHLGKYYSTRSTSTKFTSTQVYSTTKK